MQNFVSVCLHGKFVIQNVCVCMKLILWFPTTLIMWTLHQHRPTLPVTLKYVCVCMRLCTHTCIHACVCVCVCACVRACILLCVHAHVHVCVLYMKFLYIYTMCAQCSHAVIQVNASYLVDCAHVSSYLPLVCSQGHVFLDTMDTGEYYAQALNSYRPAPITVSKKPPSS